MPINNEKRSSRYWLLRKAGFSAKEATKYKDLSNEKVLLLINARNDYNEETKQSKINMLKAVEEILNG